MLLLLHVQLSYQLINPLSHQQVCLLRHSQIVLRLLYYLVVILERIIFSAQRGRFLLDKIIKAGHYKFIQSLRKHYSRLILCKPGFKLLYLTRNHLVVILFKAPFLIQVLILLKQSACFVDYEVTEYDKRVLLGNRLALKKFSNICNSAPHIV